jgi:hypothetical protein
MIPFWPALRMWLATAWHTAFALISLLPCELLSGLTLVVPQVLAWSDFVATSLIGAINAVPRWSCMLMLTASPN